MGGILVGTTIMKTKTIWGYCHSRFRMGWKIKNPSKEEKRIVTEFELQSY